MQFKVNTKRRYDDELKAKVPDCYHQLWPGHATPWLTITQRQKQRM